MAAGRACASLCGLALAAAALTVTAAGAEQPPRRVDAESMFTAALHELSERDLKARYLQCSQAALQGQLGLGNDTLVTFLFAKIEKREMVIEFGMKAIVSAERNLNLLPLTHEALSPRGIVPEVWVFRFSVQCL